MQDSLLPFLLESSAARGRLVRLGPALDVILRQHAYPDNVGELLGQAVVIATLLGSALKYDGVFTLQAKSDGAVNLLVADVTSSGTVRGYAQYDAARVATETRLLGQGHLVLTVDQKNTDERYQGVVQLEPGETLTKALQTYFKKSEQIPTGLVVAVERGEGGRFVAGGLLLQRMPSEGGIDAPADTSIEDDWLRAMSLMQTCTKEELTAPLLPPEDLLFRLFHEEGVRVFESRTFRHECRCSEEKIGRILGGMPQAEVQDMLENDVVTVSCQFCGRKYVFTPEQLERYREAG